MLSNSKCSKKIDSDLEVPKGWECNVLNENKFIDGVIDYLNENETINPDEFVNYLSGLSPKPLCNCINTVDNSEKVFECQGYFAQSPERYLDIKEWANTKLIELHRLRRKAKR